MLLPAETEVGDAAFVTTKSAWAAVATTSAATAVLLDEFGSDVAELTVAFSLIGVPAAVPPFTLTVYVIVAGEPAANAGSTQVNVPRVQIHPAGPVNDCAVVFAGKVFVSVTLVAPLGPALLTTWV